MARSSMQTRGELVKDSPERLRRLTLCFPLYENGPYRPWQMDLAFRVLASLGPPDVPIDYRRISSNEAREIPLVSELKDLGRLHSVATFREYMFNWPERLCVDAALDAERMCALLRKGKRVRRVHDLQADGLPNLFAMTAGPIMGHRSAGREMTAKVAERIPPSASAQSLSYSPRIFPENQNSPPLLDDDTTVKLADLRHAVVHEHARSLSDVLFTRTGIAWARPLAREELRRAAEAIAVPLGWDQSDIERQVEAFQERCQRMFGPTPG